jgi:hypothetical protein
VLRRAKKIRRPVTYAKNPATSDLRGHWSPGDQQVWPSSQSGGPVPNLGDNRFTCTANGMHSLLQAARITVAAGATRAGMLHPPRV